MKRVWWRICHGAYLKDFYVLPAILIHNSRDGIEWEVELAWFKWYIGICREDWSVKG
jgi:hypothetical protein